tara:strand:+ start:502 stop:897 length:396 start_codon:yes stop_codon:yes gene_type:complete
MIKLIVEDDGWTNKGTEEGRSLLNLRYSVTPGFTAHTVEDTEGRVYKQRGDEEDCVCTVYWPSLKIEGDLSLVMPGVTSIILAYNKTVGVIEGDTRKRYALTPLESLRIQKEHEIFQGMMEAAGVVAKDIL